MKTFHHLPVPGLIWCQGSGLESLPFSVSFFPSSKMASLLPAPLPYMRRSHWEGKGRGGCFLQLLHLIGGKSFPEAFSAAFF